MDQTNHQFACDLSLDALVANALIELERLGYSRRSLRRYRSIWQHLISSQSAPDVRYSDDLGTHFVETHRIHDGEPVAPQDRWRRHVVFAVKVLGTLARDGRIERSRTDVQKIGIPPAMKKPLRDFEHYCSDRLFLRPSTLNLRIKELAIFLAFLRTRDIQSLDQLQPAELTAFVAFRPRLKPKTLSRIVSDVRSFLRFLTLRGILHRDLTHVLPTIRVPRDAAIPAVWDPELVVRLLEVVDRSSPRGKRDYAILLLACRLGLRAGDIRALTLDAFNWEADLIEFTQSKTGTPLQLPLTEEVGEALIDYPQTNYREVFLTLNPPFAPFAEYNNLYHIVTYWRQLAGIQFRSAQHGGLHSLRHTLATQLLRAETPFHVISEILGHATTASTLIYAKADVEALRGAALDTEEVGDDRR
jgi:integrase